MQSNNISYIFQAIDNFTVTAKKIGKSIDNFEKKISNLNNSFVFANESQKDFQQINKKLSDHVDNFNKKVSQSNKNFTTMGKGFDKIGKNIKKNVSPSFHETNKEMEGFNKTLKTAADGSVIANDKISKSFDKSSKSLGNLVSKTGKFKIAYHKLFSGLFIGFGISRAAFGYSREKDEALNTLRAELANKKISKSGFQSILSTADVLQGESRYSRGELLSAAAIGKKSSINFTGKDIADALKVFVERIVPSNLQFRTGPLADNFKKFLDLTKKGQPIPGSTITGSFRTPGLSPNQRGFLPHEVLARMLPAYRRAFKVIHEKEDFYTVIMKLKIPLEQLSLEIANGLIPPLKKLTSFLTYFSKLFHRDKSSLATAAVGAGLGYLRGGPLGALAGFFTSGYVAGHRKGIYKLIQKHLPTPSHIVNSALNPLYPIMKMYDYTHGLSTSKRNMMYSTPSKSKIDLNHAIKVDVSGGQADVTHTTSTSSNIPDINYNIDTGNNFGSNFWSTKDE